MAFDPYPEASALRESLDLRAPSSCRMMDKPTWTDIEGLVPAISIEQEIHLHNPLQARGTITEIYDYLRSLFARGWGAALPTHGQALEARPSSQMVERPDHRRQ